MLFVYSNLHGEFKSAVRSWASSISSWKLHVTTCFLILLKLACSVSLKGLLLIMLCMIGFDGVFRWCDWYCVWCHVWSFVNFCEFHIRWNFWVWQPVAVTHILFSLDSNAFLYSSSFRSINFFSWISSLCSLVICWCLFIISAISISRLVRLYTIYFLFTETCNYYTLLRTCIW